ncbi:glutamate-gated chloride channel alpha-like [Brevipalpus obovatus]|uniref:glutamate-gated chloride channel alpha-like n=1 Tax=Brevipalpus obovatus TaxID=246614 RepID=UPI003D9E211D
MKFLPMLKTHIFWPIFFIVLSHFPVHQTGSLDSIIPVGYNRYEPPHHRGSPVNVSIKIFVVRILNVDEVEQSFTVDMLYHQFWKDHRLNLSLPDAFESTVLDSSWQSKLWIPDTYFSNALSGSILTLIRPIMYLEITNSTELSMFSRLSVKFTCDMNLFAYPQDIQECYIDIVSLAHNTQNVILRWESFDLLPSNYCPRFFIRNHTYVQWIEQTSTGNFSCLRAGIRLFRRLSYYVLRIYAPSLLVTITSFVGFWIPVVAWPARVTVAVTPLLTMITMQTQINSEINVSYVVALHMWIMLCTFFIFATLIEFPIAVSYAYFAEERANKHNRDSFSDIHIKKSKLMFIRRKLVYIIDMILNFFFGPIDWHKAPLTRNKMDYTSRILFPCLFGCFVFIYFLVFVLPRYTFTIKGD